MGCSGFDGAILDSEENLIIKVYRGYLIPDSKFYDTLIKSEEELSQKLRVIIASRVRKDTNSNELTYNIHDDILTKSTNINFEENYVIAINGVFTVLKAEDNNGNYLIYHDNQVCDKNIYNAIVVRKIEGEPRIILATPKKFSSN